MPPDTPYDPSVGCTSCHGSNLEGQSNYTLVSANNNGTVGPAGDLLTNPPCCTTCHGVKW